MSHTFPEIRTPREGGPVKSLLAFLNEVHGVVAECVENENGVAELLYLQDSSMKDTFHFYPDRFCIDCKFVSFETDFCMYTFLCEDSNGEHHIIGVGFLQKNDFDSLLWLFETFKRHNPDWRKIKTMVVDPKVAPRELVKMSFPLPFIITCFYHASASFEDFINHLNKSRSISDEQSAYAINFLFDIFHASQAEYDQYAQKHLDLPEILVSYIYENWISKESEWRIHLDYVHENIFMNLNLYLKELSSDIDSLCKSEERYIEFIKELVLMILWKKHKMGEMFLQPVSSCYSKFLPEYEITKALTPYAAKFVIEQLYLSSKATVVGGSLRENYYFEDFRMTIEASATRCSCNFFVHTLLPCRHIFAIRRINNLCAFGETTMIDSTWSVQYYNHALACIHGILAPNTESHILHDLASVATLSYQLFEICLPVLRETSKEICESRLQVIKKLVEAWKMGSDVRIQVIDSEAAFAEEKKIEYRSDKVSSMCSINNGHSSYYGKDNVFENNPLFPEASSSNTMTYSSPAPINTNEVYSFSHIEKGCRSNEVLDLDMSVGTSDVQASADDKWYQQHGGRDAVDKILKEVFAKFDKGKVKKSLF